MFHLMRLNTAIGLLLGSVMMVLTDMPEIRADRHTCTGFAGAIHFFYLLAAAMVLMEGIADFISVTSGAIGGKLKSYVAFSWGERSVGGDRSCGWWRHRVDISGNFHDSVGAMPP